MSKEYSTVYLLRNRITGKFIGTYRRSGPERKALFVSKRNAEEVAVELGIPIEILALNA